MGIVEMSPVQPWRRKAHFARVLTLSRQLCIYFGFAMLSLTGTIRDYISHVMSQIASLGKRRSKDTNTVPLISNSQDFYYRRYYSRVLDVFNRPISSAPGTWIDIMERVRLGDSTSALKYTNRTVKCLNLGSYNYLGFAANDEYCTPRVIKSVHDYGVSTCSPYAGAGMTDLHMHVEKTVADFLGLESAFVYGMGFATNSCTIPLLVEKNCLVISDEFNHKSIVDGVRLSGASVKVFKHNNMAHLEWILRRAIIEGHPRTRRPWKKILIIVEGIYSMEGGMVDLPQVVALKKKYNAYLYLDEAHSIGALGKSGRGICEQYGVDPKDIDIMMGTFTKSFGSCGGYIAGTKEIIDYIRSASPASFYATSMSPAAVQQVVSAMEVISGKDGTTRGMKKLNALKANSNYFRQELQSRGFQILGDEDSPVVPVMCYFGGKIPALSRLCLERHLAIVMVGFPATELLLSRMRICISASHTLEELKLAIDTIDEIGEMCLIKYDKELVNKSVLKKLS